MAIIEIDRHVKVQWEISHHWHLLPAVSIIVSMVTIISTDGEV